MSSEDKPSRPVNRRGFFRAGLRELLNGVSKAAEPLQRALEPLAKLEETPDKSAPQGASLNVGPEHANRSFSLDHLVLRPPGALREKEFLSTCTRCGRCVDVCPANCIKIDRADATSPPPRGSGAPYIDADTMPCVVCEPLACMNTCPSGALQPIPLLEIDMGTAVWREDNCIRSKNEECRICVEKCPIGAAAIDIAGPQVIVNPHHCIGCGLCQHYCPTSPKAVVVIPVAARG